MKFKKIILISRDLGTSQKAKKQVVSNSALIHLMSLEVAFLNPFQGGIYPYVQLYTHSNKSKIIRECGSSLYVGMAQGVSFSLRIYIMV